MFKERIGFILIIIATILMFLFDIRSVFVSPMGLGFSSSPAFYFGLRYLTTLLTIIGMVLILIPNYKHTFLLTTTIIAIASVPIRIMTIVIQMMPFDFNELTMAETFLLQSSIGFIPIVFVAYYFSFYKRLSKTGRILTIMYASLVIISDVILRSLFNMEPLIDAMFYLTRIHPFVNISISFLLLLVLSFNLAEESKKII